MSDDERVEQHAGLKCWTLSSLVNGMLSVLLGRDLVLISIMKAPAWQSFQKTSSSSCARRNTAAPKRCSFSLVTAHEAKSSSHLHNKASVRSWWGGSVWQVPLRVRLWHIGQSSIIDVQCSDDSTIDLNHILSATEPEVLNTKNFQH